MRARMRSPCRSCSHCSAVYPADIPLGDGGEHVDGFLLSALLIPFLCVGLPANVKGLHGSPGKGCKFAETAVSKLKQEGTVSSTSEHFASRACCDGKSKAAT